MPKRVLQGLVVSDKNDKTVVVQVEEHLAARRLDLEIDELDGLLADVGDDDSGG